MSEKYDVEYVEYIIENNIVTEMDIENGLTTFIGMSKNMAERGAEGWYVVNAWQRAEFDTTFILASVWQRKVSK